MPSNVNPMMRNLLKRVKALEEFRAGFRIFGQVPAQTTAQAAQAALDNQDADLLDDLHDHHKNWRNS